MNQASANQFPASTPIVSIVVTCYNGAKYLASQLTSIVEQSYQQLEIIVADDGSLDDSRHIAEQFAATDNRIKLLPAIGNIGLHRNLERGLRAASGEYIAIADHDDIWQRDKIERHLKALDGKIGSYSDSALIDGEGRSLGRTLFQTLNIKPNEQSASLVQLLFKNCISGHALLFHRELLNWALPFEDGFIFDHQLALAAALAGGLSYIPEPLVNHRIHGGNHTNGGLAGKTAAQLALSRKELNAQRLSERREHLMMQRDRIAYVLARLPQAQQSTWSTQIDGSRLNEQLQGIPELIDQFDQQFFNWTLFKRLRTLGIANPQCKKLRFKRCISLAKGARWYQLANKLAIR